MRTRRAKLVRPVSAGYLPSDGVDADGTCYRQDRADRSRRDLERLSTGIPVWFISELFRALNEFDEESAASDIAERRSWYRSAGFPQNAEQFALFAEGAQEEIAEGALSYNHAFRLLYGNSEPWRLASRAQTATFDELELRQRENEGARHRVVGLVVETRPDAITPAALMLIRRLGCTKVQMGIQTLDQEILDLNERGISIERIGRAFELLRIFGFKITRMPWRTCWGRRPSAIRPTTTAWYGAHRSSPTKSSSTLCPHRRLPAHRAL